MRMQNNNTRDRNFHIIQTLKKQKNLGGDNHISIDANYDKLSLSVNEFHFSIRTLNCLKNLDIKDIGELIQNSEKFLLRSPNFGRKSLFEVKNVLKDLNLKLNTSIKWPPENYDLKKTISTENKNHLNVIDPYTKEFLKLT